MRLSGHSEADKVEFETEMRSDFFESWYVLFKRMFLGYRSVRYCVVVFWGRIGASRVFFLGLFDPRAQKEIKPQKGSIQAERYIIFWLQGWFVFATLPILFCFCLCVSVVLEVFVFQELSILVNFRGSQEVSSLQHVLLFVEGGTYNFNRLYCVLARSSCFGRPGQLLGGRCSCSVTRRLAKPFVLIFGWPFGAQN